MRLINFTLLPALLASTLLSGCSNVLDKLDNINKPPPMAAVSNPKEDPEYKPLTWPMPENPPPPKQYANSLWQPGARTFFRDGRASRVGDILRVKVQVNDKLQFNNQTEAKREYEDQAGAPNILGLGRKIAHFAPLTQLADTTSLVDVNADHNTKGTGKVTRQDVITTEVAAMVTQMLPNGNMVIEGKQEITMNFDVREVGVHGVIRPQDISSDNTIDSSQIAEARITYSGRGQMTNMQQPRWGGQVIEAISPF